MTITDYTDRNHITVCFSDGKIVLTTMEAFRRGSVKRENNKNNSYKNIQGKTIETADGPALVCDYRDYRDYDIRLAQTGEIRTVHYPLREFSKRERKRKENGSPRAPYIRGRVKEGDVLVNDQGFSFTVLSAEYPQGKAPEFTVKFEDGTVHSCRTSAKNLVKIAHPRFVSNSLKNKNDGKDPVVINGIQITDEAYIYAGEHNFFCRCPVCGEYNIWTMAEIRAHYCSRAIKEKNDAE